MYQGLKESLRIEPYLRESITDRVPTLDLEMVECI